MKILHICCNLAGSSVFPQLFEALKEKGIEQEVFVPEKRAADLGKNLPQGVKTHCELTVRRSDALLFFRKAQRSVPCIEQRVDMRGIDLIHAHTLFTDGSIAMRLSRRTGVPYMLTLRYSDIEVIWRYEVHLRPLARKILSGARRIVFLSEAGREKVLTKWFGAGERDRLRERTAVIPNGIDPAWLDGVPAGEIGKQVRVGFAGRLNKRKCPLDALKAVQQADKQDDTHRYSLLACGDGPLKEKLTAFLRPQDRYMGTCRGMEAMKAFYRQCDLLLVPSKAETFGMVYLEAMSQGVPVLYTRGQGFDGQFAEGEIGRSVRCGDIEDQAAAIWEMTKDYAQRSERCICRAAEYAWPLIAGKWAALYAQAI